MNKVDEKELELLNPFHEQCVINGIYFTNPDSDVVPNKFLKTGDSDYVEKTNFVLLDISYRKNELRHIDQEYCEPVNKYYREKFNTDRVYVTPMNFIDWCVVNCLFEPEIGLPDTSFSDERHPFVQEHMDRIDGRYKLEKEKEVLS